MKYRPLMVEEFGINYK